MTPGMGEALNHPAPRKPPLPRGDPGADEHYGTRVRGHRGRPERTESRRSLAFHDLLDRPDLNKACCGEIMVERECLTQPAIPHHPEARRVHKGVLPFVMSS